LNVFEDIIFNASFIWYIFSMAVIEMGTHKLRPQKSHTATACDEICETESVQERRYVYLRIHCSSEHSTSEQRIENIVSYS
jgi:hypothetical protein